VEQVAIHTQKVTFRYGDRLALDNVGLTIRRGELFGLLGPNGGGKTTLFRVLTTHFPIQPGRVWVLGFDAARNPFAVRQRIGVVFQHPSLDKKLTVAENLRHHGRLYGLGGREIRLRTAEMLDQMGLLDRADERVERLSGGLARRAELAKGLLHQPELLILDEPSTGLDPGGRHDLWQYLRKLQSSGTTIVTTTHLLDEAERCDRIAILDRGRIVAIGAPADLRAEIGGDVITVDTRHTDRVARLIEGEWSVSARRFDGAVRFEHTSGRLLIARLYELARDDVDAVSVSRPTLEDVFLHHTGHRFRSSSETTAGFP
jgi:ABC-2 type transport system ATP-binding protein